MESLAPVWQLILGIFGAGLIVYGIVGLVSGGKKGSGIFGSIVSIVGGAILASMAAMGPTTTINLFESMGSSALRALSTMIVSLLEMFSNAFK